MSVMTSDRLAWIDAAKGVAITLVVFGHCWIGLHGAGLIPNEPLSLVMRDSIYLFHMPLFFVVSGLLTQRLGALPFPRFMASRALLLLWPMVLWTYLMNAGKLAMGGLANEPVTWDSFNWSPLPPQWQFWFLWALFLHQLVLWCLTRAAEAGNLRLTHWHWGGVSIAAILIYTFGGTFGVADPFLRSALLFAPYFFFGVMLRHLPELPVISPVWALTGFTLAQAVYLLIKPPLPVTALLAFVCALAVMALCRWAAEHARLTALTALGAASMAIYLAQTFFSAPLRAVLQKLDITSLPLHALLGTAIGILGPLALLWVARRTGTRRLLGI